MSPVGLCSLGLLLGAAHAFGDETDQTLTSTLVFADDEALEADATHVDVGLRRGLRALDSVRFTHLMDNLPGETPPESLVAAEEQLETVAALLREGKGDEAYALVDPI